MYCSCFLGQKELLSYSYPLCAVNILDTYRYSKCGKRGEILSKPDGHRLPALFSECGNLVVEEGLYHT